jgi:membrane protease YdiL (CAAX protease family)
MRAPAFSRRLRRAAGAPATVPSGAALLLVVIEALLIAPGHVLAGELADGALALLLASLWRVPAPPPAGEPALGACRALAVVAVSRVIALGLPLRDASPAIDTLVVALLVGGTSLAAAPLVGASLRSMFRVRAGALQLVGVLAGLLLGLLAHFLGAGRLWGAGAGGGQVMLVLLAAGSAALVEELLFRWVVQIPLQRIAPRFGILASTALFAASYLGAGSAALVLVVALAGAVFAVVVYRGGTLLGAAGGHVCFVLSAGALWPWLLGGAGAGLAGASWVLAALALALAALAAAALLRGAGGIRLSPVSG